LHTVKRINQGGKTKQHNVMLRTDSKWLIVSIIAKVRSK